ncbi:MAG TPA: dipeptidase [Pyrinomonadaceae bacterium]|nr:dipeptidase [Pyrinomonadaceae bacterium]
MKRKLLIALLVVVAVGAWLFFFVVPGAVERSFNGVLREPPYEASARARELHRRLFVADLHADTLLWDRDLLGRGARGHVDLPRLVEGGVALQFFTVVTKAPRGMNIERTGDDTDNVTPLAVAQRWPVRTWGSLTERALHQARRLGEAEARAGGQLVFVRTAGDLARFVERRGREPQAVAALLGVEGAHALDGRLENLDALFDAGVRMMAPTHFFDNEWGGSAHGVAKGGLTERGRELIRRMEARGVLVDLAHASPRTMADALAMTTRPVVVSHTGVRGTCDNARNLSDEQVRAVAATGGVVGVGFWETATCGTDARAIARAARHVADLAGVAHIALGSDFDGAVVTPFDATGLPLVTDALLAEGFSEEEVALVMGGNVLRLLAETLPR